MGINPYDAPVRGDSRSPAASNRPARRPWLGHALGVMGSIWGVAAWLEWVIIPLLVVNSGGPTPYLAFAPQAIMLFIGCVVLAALILLHAMLEARILHVLYALPPTAYVVFQVWRIL